MRLVKATCPACGGSIEVADNLASATCLFCGAKIILDWEGQTSVAADLELGLSYLQAGTYQEADQCFSRILEKNPRFGDAWFWKAALGLLQRQGVAATEVYWQKSTFSVSEAAERPAKFLEGAGQNWAEALMESVLAFASRPHCLELRVAFLEASMETYGIKAADASGQPLTGSTSEQAAWRADPGNQRTLERLLAGYVQLGADAKQAARASLAGACWARVRQLCVGDARALGRAYIRGAVAAFERGDDAEGSAFFSEANRLAGTDKRLLVASHLGLAHGLGKAGRFDEAAGHLEAALQLGSEYTERIVGTNQRDSVGYLGLARLACEAGRRDLAEEYLRLCKKKLRNYTVVVDLAAELGLNYH